MFKQKVLVIMCSFNGEKYIKEQIMSILNQLAVDLEIMVFDDQSTDDTVLIVNELCKLNNNITLIINKEQSGSAAKNFCNSIKSLSEEIISRYDYIALSDQDDIWLPNKLQFAIHKLAQSNASLYASNLTIWDEKTNKMTLLKKDYPQKKYDFLFEGGSAGCTYVMPSNLVLEISNCFKRINLTRWKFLSHDWLIYFYCRINKKEVFIDFNSYILYRIHSSNVHGAMNIISFNSFFRRAQLFFSSWYFYQTTYFKENFLDSNQDEYNIYHLYNLNWFTRIFVIIKYNTQLFRDRRKFLIFLFFNLFSFFNQK